MYSDIDDGGFDFDWREHDDITIYCDECHKEEE